MEEAIVWAEDINIYAFHTNVHEQVEIESCSYNTQILESPSCGNVQTFITFSFFACLFSGQVGEE